MPYNCNTGNDQWIDHSYFPDLDPDNLIPTNSLINFMKVIDMVINEKYVVVLNNYQIMYPWLKKFNFESINKMIIIEI